MRCVLLINRAYKCYFLYQKYLNVYILDTNPTISHFFQHLSINVSIFTLVVIALDRYRAIVWPLKGSYSKLRAKINLIYVWIFGTTLALPNLFAFHVSIWIKILHIALLQGQLANYINISKYFYVVRGSS